MTPTPGDILVSHNARLDAYTAIQVTGLMTDGKIPQVSVLTLDWIGKALPTDAEIAAMKPQPFDFFFWNAHLEHIRVALPVPPAFTRVGHRPPLVVEEVNSYGGWPRGDTLHSQQQWDARPKAARDRFKDAAEKRDKTPVLTLGDITLTRSTQRMDGERLAAAEDLSVFDALPLLTNVTTDRPIAGLFDFLRKHPFVYEADLRRHGETIVDLRGTHVTRLGIDVTGVRELYLPDGLDSVSLHGVASADLRIHAEADGRWLSLNTVDPVAPWAGLDALGGLWIHDAKDVDMAQALRHFPAVRQLRIWGAPGYLRNLSSLATLSGLRSLTLSDVFGFSPDDFPAPSNFPELQMLWLTSIPVDVAAAVKKTYKSATAAGLDLAVRQPRKPEWLAANLDNPFRNWDGRENITPAQAKKAAALYKTARGDALKLAGAADAVAALTPMVLRYTEAFNALDSRGRFVFTDEREQIYEALLLIFDAVDETRREAGADPVDRHALSEAMDDVRDF